jgi:hypothetical protein
LQRDEGADPVPEPGGDHLGVLGEALGGGPARPAAAVLEGLRQVPVVEGGGRRDAGAEQLVDEPVVERQPRLVHRSELPRGDLRGDPRPGDGEAVGPDAELPHDRDVLAVAVVVVVGDVAGVPPSTLPGVRLKTSQIDGVRPSSWAAPSIW